MKRSTISLFSAAILIVVAAVDFGIAHAVGTNTLSEGVHGAIGEFMEWQPLQVAITPHSEEVHGPIGGVR